MYRAYKNTQSDTYIFFDKNVEIGKIFTFQGEKIESQLINKLAISNLHEVNFSSALKYVVYKTMTKHDFHSTYKVVV